MFRLLAALGLVFVFALPSRSAGFTPAPLGSFLLDLDTPSSHGSVWELDTLGSVNGLRATATIRGLQLDVGRIKPGILIALNRGGESVNLSVMWQFTEGAFAVVLLHFRRGGELIASETFLTGANLKEGQPFDIAIDWTSDGTVTATLAGKESHAAKLAGAPVSVEVDGFSCEVEFKPLTLGQTP